MRFHREQYLELMTFGASERPMFVELFGLLVGVEDEWRAQGASQEEIDLVAFDLGLCAGCKPRRQHWLSTHGVLESKISTKAQAPGVGAGHLQNKIRL